ncbi:MAG: hypothetical protein J1E58_07990 [Prevotella sp.]|nr:hypothetical protein [Prevotella sp.]
MKQIWIAFCLLWVSASAGAQQYPPEWVRYTYGGYMYDIQSGSNDRNLSETDFKNYLLDIARANLAKQIEVRVQDVAELTKAAVDGRSSITYLSTTKFSTDVNLKLVGTKTAYSPIAKIGYAIAYIDRDAARNYYKNELTLIHNKVNNSVAMAESFISAGFKSKAQTELESSLQQVVLADEQLFWLNVFGEAQSGLADWQGRFNTAEQKVKQMLADLRHATVIYLTCAADIFGNSYPTLQNELKGILAADGCSFTDNPANADWVITVTCHAREYSNVNVGKSTSYFSYVDAQITIDKIISSQRIYEDEVSVKGGHTFGYTEAAKAGYKEIKQQIGKIIKNNIEL